jgi:hypothetical protein
VRDWVLCQLFLALEKPPVLPLTGYSSVDRDLGATSLMCWLGVFLCLAVTEEALSVRDRMGWRAGVGNGTFQCLKSDNENGSLL